MSWRREWEYTLRLGDIFHNEDMSFEQKRDEIVRRIKAAGFWDEDDYDLGEAVELLAEAEDVRDFDVYWDQFYDWADDNRVWVDTFGSVA